MRKRLNRRLVKELMHELAREARGKGPHRIYLLGGGTAVLAGWRDSTIDADLLAEEEALGDLQKVKERLQINIELIRPEHSVPPLEGSEDRHVFIEQIESLSFFHYDPYAQLLSKVVRGFRRDMQDARHLVESGMVNGPRFAKLVQEIPDRYFTTYPSLSRDAVLGAVDAFLQELS